MNNDNKKIAFRYALGTIVEKVFKIAAICGTVHLVISILEWICTNMPNWLIPPMLVSLVGLMIWAGFHNDFNKEEI